MREAYRVRLERGPLQVFLVVDDVATQAELIDLASGGAAIGVTAEVALGLRIGAEVSLRIEAGDQRVFARSLVRSVGSGDVVIRVGLQFSERERVWAQLDERLWRYFNRRQGFRVGPGRDQRGPAVVTLRGPGTEFAGVIHDLSTTGLSIRVSTKDDVRFTLGELFSAEFTLPIPGPPFRLGVVAMHESVVRGSRRVGFRFDPLATPGLEHEVERILQYVLERQRRNLQDQHAAEDEEQHRATGGPTPEDP